MAENTSIRDQWAKKDARSNVKQHCNKISQGLDKLNNMSSTRAIWELVQNAIDLAKENPSTGKKECSISIELTQDEFIFAHKGNPFTFDSLNSLVKQVSSEEKEDDDKIGQYGTGFLTTHSFGRKILIDGSFLIEEVIPNQYVDIDGFVIDREFDKIPEFVDKMADQIVQIYKYEEYPRTNICREWTKLKYQLASVSGALDKAELGITQAIKLMPYVMTINDSIVEAKIEDRVLGRSYIFTKTDCPDERELHVKRIAIINNGNLQYKNIYYLQSDDLKDIVIFPLRDATHAESLDGIAKLFVYLPLIGSENFGMNFIFHSGRFYPEEERNNVILPRDNDNVKFKYESNEQVLHDMSQMVFDYLKTYAHEIDGLVDVVGLNFDCENNNEHLTDSFFERMKDLWVSNYRILPMIPISDGKMLSCDDVSVFDETIVSMLEDDSDGNNLSIVYKYALMNATLPIINEVVKWSKIISKWGNACNQSAITLDLIAENVMDNGCILGDLHNLLSWMKQGSVELFQKYSLLPNREGKLCKRNELVNADEISDNMYEIISKFIPNITQKFVDSEYSDIVELSEFSYRDLRTSVNEKLEDLNKEYIKNDEPLDSESVALLIQYCSFCKESEKNTLRQRMLPLIARLENREDLIDNNYRVLPDMDIDIMDTPFNKLLQSSLLKISQQNSSWVVDNRQLLIDILEELHDKSDFKDLDKGYVTQYSLFPNRKNELCLAIDLKKNQDIDEDFIELTKRVLDRDLIEEFVDEDFEKFYDFKFITIKEVGPNIEETLADHEYTDTIVLDIIEHLDEGKWQDAFKYIRDNKESLFFKQAVTSDSKKSSVYKLMKVQDEEMLSVIANITDNPRAQEILNRVQDEMEMEAQKEADFQFKYKVGTYIEDILRNSISSEMRDRLGVEVLNNQNGQDIEIRINNTPIYYVEVKSKWDLSTPTHMSRYQMNKACNNPNNYALCCVDLSSYDVNDTPDINTVLANTYIHLHIAEELESIMMGIVEADRCDSDSNIQMGGEYHSNIPERIFKTGDSFDVLIERVKNVISEFDRMNIN